jgi:hypothetical protein
MPQGVIVQGVIVQGVIAQMATLHPKAMKEGSDWLNS